MKRARGRRSTKTTKKKSMLHGAHLTMIAQIVRTLGQKEGLDVEEIARRIGMSRSSLYHAMRLGRISLYVPAKALAELAGVNPDLIADYYTQRAAILARTTRRNNHDSEPSSPKRKSRPRSRE